MLKSLCSVILLILTIVQCTKLVNSDDLMNTQSFNNGIDLSQSCKVYTDCFNCTLANCDWSMTTKCTKKEKEKLLTVDDFLSTAPKCKDTLNLCDKASPKVNTTELSFAKSARIPANYFCI